MCTRRARKARRLQVALPSDGSRHTARILDEGSGRRHSRCHDCFREALPEVLYAIHGFPRFETEGEPDRNPVLDCDVADLPVASYLHRATYRLTLREVRGVGRDVIEGGHCDPRATQQQGVVLRMGVSPANGICQGG